MGKQINLVGRTFGKLIVIEYLGREKMKWSYYLCQCECGRSKPIRIDHLQSGKTISCGCEGQKRRMTSIVTHNQSYHPLCAVWHGMLRRCYNEECEEYPNYGGRGIKVSDEWLDLNKFIKDVSEGYRKGLELDRIKNDEWYSKTNFKWSTHTQNNRNKRTNLHIVINGVDKIAVEWAEETGVCYQTIVGRFNRGWKNMEILDGRKHVV